MKQSLKQQQFEQEHAALWEDISAILEDRSPQPAALPALYRRLAQCQALAAQRGYSPALGDYLQGLAAACHLRLYGARAERPRILLGWLLADFPRRVRAEWRLLLAATLAVWGVALALGLLVANEPHWAYSFMDQATLDKYRHMYSPGAHRLGRDNETDVLMFGHYIWNNVSICFRTFAAGIFGGLPSLLLATFNGMHIGVLAAWLSLDDNTRHPFWSFVIAHASVEITALVLSTMAGMRLGLAVLSPGRLSRRHALLLSSQAMFPVLLGAALMTVLAAFIEAFWSSIGTLPLALKYGVGAACWAAVIAFFTLAGRRGGDAA